jgi:hypothetical protein
MFCMVSSVASDGCLGAGPQVAEEHAAALTLEQRLGGSIVLARKGLLKDDGSYGNEDGTACSGSLDVWIDGDSKFE